jgi:hypothetical protein
VSMGRPEILTADGVARNLSVSRQVVASRANSVVLVLVVVLVLDLAGGCL